MRRCVEGVDSPSRGVRAKSGKGASTVDRWGGGRVLRFALLLGVLGVLGGATVGCDFNATEIPKQDYPVAPLPNMRIATLRERCAEGPVTFRAEGVVLAGYVTSSDRANNFYRSLFLEDNSGAMELMTGLYDQYNRYPLGMRVVVTADSLCAMLSEGVLQLGLPRITEGRSPESLGSTVVADRHLHRTSDRITPAPYPASLSRLEPRLMGCLVHLSHLKLDPAVDTTWAISARRAEDGVPHSVSLKFRAAASRDSLYVTTSGYAQWADAAVPKSLLSMVGVLSQTQINGRAVYQLTLRDLQDVQME
ncbi:MAG: DUF5689 domain-containing protein [Alistipes sp.]|nr:DUF5689 domain-containing protein [Alistipes sp.]